jgi:glycosyltransferase involved in cell wall biosynthesis
MATKTRPENNMAKSDTLHVLEMATQFGVGGITRHILALRDSLRAKGHRITLGGTANVWANPENEADFLALPTRNVAGEGGGLVARLLSVAKAAWLLRRWLRKNPVDLIHAHESAPALVANIARKGLNIPLVITYHGSEPERIAGFGRIAAKCDLVITPSHRSADDLASIGGVPRDKLKVIGLGVNPAPIDDADEIAQLREGLVGDGKQLIITIARLEHQKGIDILIDCVAKYSKTHPQARFVIAGDGPDEEKLQALARQKGVDGQLQFLGRVSRPHLYLRASDLFLLTSRWEALPFTIVEAFQAGTPSVAAACSGVVELIDDSVGAVVPIGDIEAFCAALERILSDDKRRIAMGKAALERSREDRFRPDWVHDRFEQTYLDLAQR